MIASGMGGGAIDIFEERKVKVVLGATGEARAAVEAYLQGQLESTGRLASITTTTMTMLTIMVILPQSKG